MNVEMKFIEQNIYKEINNIPVYLILNLTLSLK